tara:strand:+ start:17608 stop:17958 length:351 start_codon:yes stop_codon:yes gene_type:complete
MKFSREEFNILNLPSDPWFFSHRDRTRNGSSIQSPEVGELIDSLLKDSDEEYDEETNVVRRKFRKASGCCTEDGHLQLRGCDDDGHDSREAFESFVEYVIQRYSEGVTELLPYEIR